MLDHHPQLAVANDTHFIPRAIDHAGGCHDPPLTPELVAWVRGYHRFRRLGLDDAAVDEAAAGARSFRDFVGALYTSFAGRRGKPLGGDKTPDYVRHLPLLSALFPGARFIHIVRDGRDVALSVLEWARPDKGPGRFALWSEEPVAVCGLWWRWLVGAGRHNGRALGADRYRELSYESLVADPEPALRGLATFLGLPFAPEMLTFHEGETRSEPGLSAKKAWLPPTQGLRDWRRDLPERELELFEAIAGDLLAELGYERACAGRSPAIQAVAERSKAWWEGELARRSVRAQRTHNGDT
jgi:hypothetical protein